VSSAGREEQKGKKKPLRATGVGKSVTNPTEKERSGKEKKRAGMSFWIKQKSKKGVILIR